MKKMLALCLSLFCAGMALAQDEYDPAILPGGAKVGGAKEAGKTIAALFSEQAFQTSGITGPKTGPETGAFLYAGLRLGISPRFYGLSEDVGSGSAKTRISFDAALQVSASFLHLFDIEVGLQTELLFGTDTVSYEGTDSEGIFTASLISSSMAIPVLAKASYRISDRFVASLFTGPYFSIPLGKVEYTSPGKTNSYTLNIPAGWLIGIAPGLHIGPGTLFADIRYGGDFGNTSISDGNGALSVYSRNAVSFTLGYEFGFIRK